MAVCGKAPHAIESVIAQAYAKESTAEVRLQVNDNRESPVPIVGGRPFGKRQMGQAVLRMGGAAAALLANIVVARQLTLDQIAYYYLYATLAYFGNAGLYVGLGVVLQRLCASLASERNMHKMFLLRYLATSLAGGTIAVLLFSGAYLLARGSEPNPWHVAFCCASLSGATYLSSVSKDLLALSHRLSLAALFGLVEQLLRLSFVWLAVVYVHAGAIQVTAATAAASLVLGVSAIIVLLLSTASTHASVIPVVKLQGLARTVAPIGLSGLMNWLQLQSYRPILLYFGTRPEIIGIASLLTSLGMTGANPILSVISQTYIPKLYAGDSTAFRKCLSAIGASTLIAAVASIPAAIAFLIVAGRKALLIYLLLVPLGVIVEAANSLIGLFIHRRNAAGQSMWIFAVAGSVGVVLVGVSWLFPYTNNTLPYVIGVGMVASQIAIIGAIVALSKHIKALA